MMIAGLGGRGYKALVRARNELWFKRKKGSGIGWLGKGFG